jgi:hypothetical protein
MKTIKRLGTAVLLTCVFALTALAGETQAPPCAPGEMNAPPCAMATGETSAPPEGGETQSPPAANDILSVAEAAMNMLLLF